MVMELLIDNFPSTMLFGDDNLKFFTSVVKCSITPTDEDSPTEEINPAHRDNSGLYFF